MTLTSLPIFLWFQESEETVPDAGREQILRVAGSDREPSAAGQPGPPCCRLQAGSGVASRSWTAEGKKRVSQEHILCAQPRQRWEKQQAVQWTCSREPCIWFLLLILQPKPLFRLNLFTVCSAPPLFSAGVVFHLLGTPVCACAGALCRIWRQNLFEQLLFMYLNLFLPASLCA